MSNLVFELRVQQGQHGRVLTRSTIASVARLALSIGSVGRVLAQGWSVMVDAGQFGPDSEVTISRQTGART